MVVLNDTLLGIDVESQNHTRGLMVVRCLSLTKVSAESAGSADSVSCDSQFLKFQILENFQV